MLSVHMILNNFAINLFWIMNTVLDWLNIYIHKSCHYFKVKNINYKIKVISFVCEATCTLQKRQDCFQISAHVSFISEMLVAHHFSKISQELEM